MDKIEIKELEIFANHGVFPEENVLGQKFVISATLYTSTRTAGLTDDLTASIHYGEVSQMITRFVQEHTYKLLETVVENLARMLLLTLPSLQKVTLKIEKPWAPVGLPLKTVSVEITREWHTAYIALGSNLGDKQKYLDDAVQGLADTEDCIVEQVSDYLVKLELTPEVLKNAIGRVLTQISQSRKKQLSAVNIHPFYDKFLISLLHDLFESEEQFRLQGRDLNLNFD